MTVATPKTTKRRGRSKGDVPGITRPMTYEEYLASPEEMARYDIIDGWKVYRLHGVKQSANPTREHQEIQGKLFLAFHTFERAARQGKVILAPCDVRITYQPLRNRQPDLLFISNGRLAENPPSDDPAPLSPAPELVVEIVSPSDKLSVMTAKIADYRAVDVREVWVVRAGTRTVDVIPLSVDEIGPAAKFGPGQTAISQAFPGLRVAVDEVWASPQEQGE